MPKSPKAAPLLAGIALFLLTVPLPLAAADPEFPSSWRKGEIAVDGGADEWVGKLIPLPGFPVDLGIQNDASFLYLCLKTSDEAQKKRIQELGVNFWMDATGKGDRAFGVRYPAGPQPRKASAQGGPPPEGEGRAGGEAPPDGEPPPREGRLVRVKRQGAPDALQVMGRDAEGGGRMTVASARPIAAAMAEKDGVLVLELKVPLAFSIETPFAILTAPGKTIALAVEGAQPDKELRSGAGHGGRGGEGSGSGVSMGHGGVNVGGVSIGRGGIGASTGGGRGGGGGGGRSGGGERPGAAPGDRSTATPFKGAYRVLISGPPAVPSGTAAAVAAPAGS